MLKNIPPLLNPDALHALASMGHGDEVAIVDANFPAARVAGAHGARLVQLSGADAPTVLRAVLTVLPLDDFGPEPVPPARGARAPRGGAQAAWGGPARPEAAWTMQVVGDAAAVPPPVAEFQIALREAGECEAVALERFAFYERAAAAFVVLRSGERRRYGNILLRKGVIG